MPKATPKTTTGRVIARIEEIEGWFRDGLKHSEVVSRLAKDGLKINADYLRQILTTYGVTERKVRRSLGREEVPSPIPKAHPVHRDTSAELPPVLKPATNGLAEKTIQRKAPSPGAKKKTDSPGPERQSVADQLREKQTTQRHKLVVEPRYKKEDVI
jgi:hypothetical protein